MKEWSAELRLWWLMRWGLTVVVWRVGLLQKDRQTGQLGFEKGERSQRTHRVVGRRDRRHLVPVPRVLEEEELDLAGDLRRKELASPPAVHTKRGPQTHLLR